jgi:hypothetical protein
MRYMSWQDTTILESNRQMAVSSTHHNGTVMTVLRLQMSSDDVWMISHQHVLMSGKGREGEEKDASLARHQSLRLTGCQWIMMSGK